MSVETSDFIQTKSSRLKQDAENNFQVVTFTSYKKKAQKESESIAETKEEVRNVGVNMKRTKHEIVKLALSGYDSQKKEEAKVQLAISLGKSLDSHVFFL